MVGRIITFMMVLVATSSCSAPTPPKAEPVARTISHEQVLPDLKADDIRWLIRSRGIQIQACYEEELKADPKLRGIIQMEFTIATDGGVTETLIVQDSVGSPVVQACAKEIIGALKFPESSDSTTVVFPFDFTPVMTESTPKAP